VCIHLFHKSKYNCWLNVEAKEREEERGEADYELTVGLDTRTKKPVRKTSGPCINSEELIIV
jgi:hypothetical protein